MPAQLDLSLLDTVKDPELRASIARLHHAMAAALPELEPVLPSGAKLIQFPLFPAEMRLVRGYPETFSHRRREITQHPCGNETQGDCRAQVCSA